MTLMSQTLQQYPNPGNTAALIVTYHPDPGFRNRLNAIVGQLGAVIVIDNTPGSSLDAQLEGIGGQSVQLIANGLNHGLGCALNQGMMYAISRGFDWVLTLDQDTEVDADMVERLCEIAQVHGQPQSVALIASNARSVKSGRLYLRRGPTAQLFREVKTPMTSGSLTSVAAYQAIGGFREDFFIGSIDLEYCLRARAHGFHVLCSERALMTHAAGDTQERSFLGRTVLISEQSLMRWYLDFRNLSWTLRRYCISEPSWTVSTVWALAKRFLLLVIYEGHRPSKIRAIVQGVRDGVLAFPEPFSNQINFARTESKSC